MNGIYRDRLEEPKKKKKQKKSGGNKKRKYAKCLLCAVARCTPSGSHMTLEQPAFSFCDACVFGVIT